MKKEFPVSAIEAVTYCCKTTSENGRDKERLDNPNMMLSKMGITVKIARIALLAAIFFILESLCSNVTAQDIDNFIWNGGAYTHGNNHTSWWGWAMRIPMPTGANDFKQDDNWGVVSPSTALNPAWTTFSQGRSATFNAGPATSVFIDTTTPRDIVGLRTDGRTVVNDMYMKAGSWAFTGSGVIGNSLSLRGSNFWLNNTTFSFAYGTQWQNGSITFTGNNVFGKYYWDPNPKITGITEPGYQEEWSSFQNLDPNDRGVINRDHNTIFVNTNGLRLQRSYTITGGQDYTLANRFDINQGVTLTLGTPWNRSVTVTGVNAFESRPDSPYHVNGGAFYLRRGANIVRANNGNESEADYPGAWNFLSNYGYQGGAIFAEQNLLLEGNSRFSFNEAAYQGGAVFMNGSQDSNILHLKTDNGDIAFHDNSSYGVNSRTEFAKLVMIDGKATAFATNADGQITSSSGTIKFFDVTSKWYPTDANGNFINNTNTSVKYFDRDSNWYNADANGNFTTNDGITPVKFFTNYGNNWYRVDPLTGNIVDNTGTTTVNNLGGNWYRYENGYYLDTSDDRVQRANEDGLWHKISIDTNTMQPYYIDDSNIRIKYFSTNWYQTTSDGSAYLISGDSNHLADWVGGANGFYTIGPAANTFLDNTGNPAKYDNISTGTGIWLKTNNAGNFINSAEERIKYYAPTDRWYRVNDNDEFITTGGGTTTTPSTNGVSSSAVSVTMVVANVVPATWSTASVPVQTVTPQTGNMTVQNPNMVEADLSGVTALTPRDDAIFLAKNTHVQIDGTRRVFFEDNITTNTDPTATEAGGNTMTVDLVGSQTNAFVQFGKDTDSLLNPSGKKGGTVKIKNGTFRMMDGSRFQTFGLGEAIFTVEQDGILAGGGTRGKSDPANYDHEKSSGTIGAANGFFIQGTLSPDNYQFQIPQNLDGRSTFITPASQAIGYLNLWGNVVFDGATLHVDLSTDQLNTITASNDPTRKPFENANDDISNSDIIMVDQISQTVGSGNLYLSKDNKSTVEIATWVGTGKYVIATSNVKILDSAATGVVVTNDNITDYFNEIIPKNVDNNQNKRLTAMISIDNDLLKMNEHDIVLQTSNNGNVNLVWTAKDRSNLQVWNGDDPATSKDEGYINWKRRNTDIDLSFWEGDFVYFNVSDNSDNDEQSPTKQYLITPQNNLTPGAGWVVGGMVVEGGNYLFESDEVIKGSKNSSKGVNATGRLDIQLSDEKATDGTNVVLALPTDFEAGTRITNATVTLGFDGSLGKYDLTGLTLAQKQANERGAVYLDNFTDSTQPNDVTIITSHYSDSRELQNHFELANTSNLTFDIPTGFDLTIANVDTSNSTLVNGIDRSHKGGAFFVSENSTLGWNGKVTLKSNIAVNGGAIYARGNLELQGNVLFDGNIATQEGGAIYMYGAGTRATLTLNTGNGDFVFTENKDSNGSNAIFMRQNSTILITGGNNVYFDDPIQTGAGGRNDFTMAGSGFVQFKSGTSILNPDNVSSNGIVTISNGTFRLADDATFETQGSQNSPLFNVTQGAALEGKGTILVQKGPAHNAKYGFNFTRSTISPDGAIFTSGLNGTTIDNRVGGNAIGTLTFEGSNVSLSDVVLKIDIGNSGVNDYIHVDTNTYAGIAGNIMLAGDNKVLVSQLSDANPNGDYLIVKTEKGKFITDDNKTTLADLMSHVSSNLSTSSARQGTGTLEFRGTANSYNELWITGYSGNKNLAIYWTGEKSTVWDKQITQNWITERGGEKLEFYDEDYVIFDNRNPAGVDVANYTVDLTENVTVSGMDVNAGNYTITGTKQINGIVGRAPGANGRLTVGLSGAAADSAQLTLDIATDFVKGTELTDGGRINLNVTNALGSYDGTGKGNVHVRGNSTIGGPNDTSVNDVTIKNQFTVDANNKLTVDVDTGKSLTVNGVTTSAVVLNDKAALDKTKTGNLVFSNNQYGVLVSPNADAKITATAGDIIFNGNTAAIYADNGSTVTINGSSRVYLGDAVATGTGANFNLTDSATAIVKNDVTINGAAKIGNATDTASLFVGNGTTFDASMFDLYKNAVITGSGTISASTIRINGTLDPNDDNYSLNGAGNSIVYTKGTNQIDSLKLEGNTVLDDATIKIDLGDGNSGNADLITSTGNITLARQSTIEFNPIGTAPTGEYRLIAITNGNKFVGDPTDAAAYFSAAGTSSDRENGYKLEFKNNGGAAGTVNELWLVGYDGPTSIDLYWNGDAAGGGPNWLKQDKNQKNWKNDADQAEYFIDNDHVIFDETAASKTVNLTANETYNVRGMDVTNATYTFNTATATIKGNSGTNLNITDANVTFGVATDFDTTNLNGTSTVTLNHAQALGSGAVNVNGSAKLVSLDNYTLDNVFTLSGDLTIDANNKTLTFGKALGGNGDFTIDKGTVKFVAAANTIGSGTFTVKSGATLDTTGNSVSITADKFDVKGTIAVDGSTPLSLIAANNVAFSSATLAVNLTASNNYPGSNAAIKITGGADFSGSNTLEINGTAADQQYLVVSTSGITGITGKVTAQQIAVTRNGQALNSREGYSLDVIGDNLVLDLYKVDNMSLYWQGGTSGNQSNAWKNDGKENWLVGPNPTAGTTEFANGDYVNFQSDLARVNIITLGNGTNGTQKGTQTVSGMNIISGNFTFNNGTLNGTTDGYQLPTGQPGQGAMLINGNGTVTFNIDTHFVNGINVTGERIIEIGDSEALGSTIHNNGSEGIVNITAGTTRVQAATGDTINNQFKVAAGANLSLETKTANLNIANTKGSTVELANNTTLTVNAGDGKSVIFKNAIHGTGTNTFIKTGAGDVVFTGTGRNDLGTASTANINGGQIILGNTGDTLAVGNFTLGKDAAVVGNGGIEAATITLTGTIDPGADEIGTLTFTGGTTFESVDLLVNLSGPTNYDKIKVNGTAHLGDNNSVIIKTWQEGTYDLITSTGTMTGNSNWNVPKPAGETGRFNAHTEQQGNILKLVAATQNTNLIWNGTKTNDWDANNHQNWTNGTNPNDSFLGGDSVIFNGLGQGTVAVNLNGETISDMLISNGKYDFSGSNLVGKKNPSLTGSNGALTITGGDATFRQTADFEGGIRASNNASVTLTDSGKLNSGKDITFGNGTTLTLTPANNLITAAGKVALDGNIVVNRPATIPTNNRFTSVISAGEALNQLQLDSIFNSTWGLNGQFTDFVTDSQMDLVYKQITAREFANQKNLQWNEKEAARGITDAFNKGKLDDLKKILYGFETDEDVLNTLDQLRGTEQAASALAMSLWQPWTKVYKQLLTRENEHDTHGVHGQAPKFKGRSVWIESYYRYLDVNSDGNAKKYYENRGGLVLGLDTRVSHFSNLGISFGYGNPKLSSKFGRVEAYDFTLALYGKTKIQDDLYLNGYAGFGFQEYEYNRSEIIGNKFSAYKGDYNGNSAYISTELYKPYKWSESWTLFPAIALDYQRAWSSGFEEKGGDYNQKIHKGNVDRFVTRFGVNSKLQYTDSVNFLTRLQYEYLLGGDTRAVANTSFVGSSTTSMRMLGVQLGRSQMNLGIGGEWYLDERKCLMFFGDYDLDFGKRNAAQTGQLGVKLGW